MSCFREQRSLRLCLCGVISFLVLLSPSFHATRTAVAAAVSLLVARLFPSFTHAGTGKMAERPVATTSSHLLALLVSTRDLAYAESLQSTKSDSWMCTREVSQVKEMRTAPAQSL